MRLKDTTEWAADRKRYMAEWYAANRERQKAFKRAVYEKAHPGAKTLTQISAEKEAKAFRPEKACKVCGIVKPVSEFGMLSNAADGRSYDCSECRRIIWRDAHPPKPKPEKPTYSRFKDTPQYAAAVKWRKAHPEHIKSLKRAEYHRNHPNAKTIAEVIAAKEAKALRSEKPCNICGAVKPLEEFTPNKTTADGRQYQCKACIQIRANIRYRRDPDKHRQRSREWQRLHPDKQRHTNQVRRARKNKVPGSHTLQEWHSLCEQFDNRCVCCGASGKLTRDHVIPITDPRCTHDIKNCQPLCYSCNSSKGNRHSEDYRMTPFINKKQIPPPLNRLYT